MIFRYTLILFVCFTGLARAHDPDTQAHYLANEGVMIVQGETKILFDPLFRNSYGQYQLPPAAIKAALLAGTPPYDGIDAVFVSHYHEDHFSPRDILDLLNAQPQMQLYAPAQATEMLQSMASAQESLLFERVNPITLEYQQPPVRLHMQGLEISAVRIPHSGWPDGQTEVQNIVYRVRLNDSTTVVHLGDADADDVHFAHDAAYWAERAADLAMPPYWFFLMKDGLPILKDRLGAAHSIGIHVPERMPDDPAQRPPEFEGFDLFTEPGETRSIRHQHD